MRSTLGLSLAFCLAHSLVAVPVAADEAEDQAVAAIKKICTSAACLEGECGLFTRDEKAAGNPVIKVDLSIATGWKGTAETDAALKELKKLKHLQSLDLTFSAVTEKELKELYSLETLNLDASAITDAGLAELKELKNLQSLSLAVTNITGTGLAELNELKSLQHLDLREARLVSDEAMKGLKELKSLQTLNLTFARVTDAGLKELKELKNLRTLILDSTKVTPAGIKELYAALPELTIYNGPPVPRTTDAGDKVAEDKTVAEITKLGGTVTRDEKTAGNVLLAGPNVSAQDAKELRPLEGHAAVNGVAFAPDGKTIAVAHGGEVTLWDLATRESRTTIKPGWIVVRRVAFAPDGRTLALGGGGGFNGKEPVPGGVRLWDVAAGKERASLTGHAGPVSPVAFSADGWVVASGDWAGEGELKLWDAVNGKVMVTLRGHDGEIHAVAISPDGKTLASGSNNHELKLWNVSTSLFVGGIGCHESANAKLTVLKVLATAKERASFRGSKEGIDGSVNALAFTPDGKTLVIGTLEGTVTLWDLAAGKAVRSWKYAPPLWSVAVSADGRLLAAGAGGGRAAAARVKVWDLATEKELAAFRWEGSWVTSVAFSADSKTLAAGGDHVVRLWEVSAFSSHKIDPQ